MVVVVLAFVAGYWPQHQKYLNALGDLRIADKQLMEARANERIYHLENTMLQVLDHTAHKEYKEAQSLTTQFFVEVRADMARPDMTKFRSELQQILDKSDIIENALQKEDPASRDALRGVMQQLAQMVALPPVTSEPPPFLKTTPVPEN
ncbi:MAG: hypothetical protein HYR58_02490 [Acidobacteria bacterium]|nr:hypothetical protein [Acidobacteriota bacterium]